ncbi:MAG: cysteine desulfurase NifS [Lachnospiraceae bacterium]|nr:cysteine desulfurase NifS [Lachnospiraceae bacterium]
MIYLDNAATTKVSETVVEGMLPFMNRKYGNPSGIYEFADQSGKAVEHAREQVASLIGAQKKEIYFTSGGSESDNWALKSVMEQYKDKGRHLITSKIEHHAILETCAWLEKQGCDITYLDVDENGFVKMNQLEKSIRKDTVCISIMTANNEIGTIQPLYEIGRLARRHNLIFHTDAVQAYGHIPIDVRECNIHLLSASAHKLHGPKGVGCLYINDTIDVPSMIYGGGQESGHRAGTENVPGIVGFGIAAEEASRNMNLRREKELKLRNYLMKRILWEIPYVRINGSVKRRLPNNANFSFQFVDGESLLILLDSAGICASAASACSAGSKEPSHVLMALGMPEELAYGTLRLTVSADNTKQEMDIVVEKIKESVSRLREMSSEMADVEQ